MEPKISYRVEIGYEDGNWKPLFEAEEEYKPSAINFMKTYRKHHPDETFRLLKITSTFEVVD